MGTNCAPLVANLVMFCYESDFMVSFSDNKQADVIDAFKEIYLSKALTYMKFFLYKQKCFFYQRDGYLWPHFCMNILYISHRSLYAPTYSF